jgi:amidase
MSETLAYTTAVELKEALASGALTSEQVVVGLLDRIGALESDESRAGLHAIAGLAADALEIARQRDRERASGYIRGPLHGIPVLIKDNIEAVGLPGLAGATALLGRPTRDAALVTQLRAAGAIIMGSTNLSQWANLRSTKSASGYSATGGLVANPWARERSAGGSSSGAGTAAAAGYAPISIGTETDGSITCPASLNGVVGLKPTVGSVSRDGIVPISHRQDSPGPLTRSVADAALAYGALTTSVAPEVTQTRLVEATTWITGHIATDTLFRDFLAAVRARGREIASRPFAKPGLDEGNDEQYALLCEFHDDLGAYLQGRAGEGVRSLADVMAFENENGAIEHRYSGHEHFTAALATGGCAAEDYVSRRDRVTRWAISECLEPGLGDDDIIISPAYAPAWKSDLVLGDPSVWFNPGISVSAIAGWPILTLPFALLQGLPLGLTLIGRPGSEWSLLAAAAELETVARERGWTGRPDWSRSLRG